jgi:hypothetical protein
MNIVAIKQNDTTIIQFENCFGLLKRKFEKIENFVKN